MYSNSNLEKCIFLIKLLKPQIKYGLDLLRRLSRSQNTVFCGRILVFLAKFFPFNERSGLNIISEFNTSNVTAFNTEDQLTDMNGDMDVDHDGPSSPKKIKVENDENK